MLKPQDGKYKLRIVEFEQEHSYFSNFELIKVIHPKTLKAGVIDNQIVFYKNVKRPAKIINKQGKDLTNSLNKNGGFNGKTGDILKLKFGSITGKESILIWRACLRAGYPRIDSVQKALGKLKTTQQLDRFLNKIVSIPWRVPIIGCIGIHSSHSSCKISIIFYLSLSGKNEKVGIIHPRENFSTGLIDLSPHFKKDSSSSLELSLEWTNTHKLNFIGLAQLASSQEIKATKINNLKPETIKHSRQKEINKNDLEKGKVELIPGQSLELTFPYTKSNLKPKETVSYLLKSKGYYKKV